MKYATLIETPQGYKVVVCTDEQIDKLPLESVARIFRDERRAGVYVTPSEIARAYLAERSRGASGSP